MYTCFRFRVPRRVPLHKSGRRKTRRSVWTRDEVSTGQVVLRLVGRWGSTVRPEAHSPLFLATLKLLIWLIEARKTLWQSDSDRILYDQMILLVLSAVAVHGVAQWSGRRFLAVGLSLTYASSVSTSRVRCPLWANQPGQLSLSSLRGWQMSSNPYNYMDYRGRDN